MSTGKISSFFLRACMMRRSLHAPFFDIFYTDYLSFGLTLNENKLIYSQHLKFYE